MRTVWKLVLIIVAVLVFSILGTQPGFSEPVTWRVLLIGIDDYKASHVSDLRGCGNDVELMRTTLIDKFNVVPENIQMLKDAQATRQGILDAIQKHLLEKAQAGDIIILHYSGHGSQMFDASKDEIDGYDETIVPHDSRTDGIFDISDDEINGLLTQLTEKTKKVTFIFDSCHSGSAARGGNTVRMIEADNRPPPASESFAITTRGAGEAGSDFRLNGSDYVLISGCLATELSNETMLNGRRHGVLTWFLVQALRSAEKNSTYKSVMDEVGAEVSSRYSSQHPQIEGPGADLRVFGADRINPGPYVLVESVAGQKVTIGGGKVYGLGRGSVLLVYPPGTGDFEAATPAGKIKITKIEDFTAEAVLLEGGPVVERSKVSLDALSFGDGSVPVFVPQGDHQTVEMLRIALGGGTIVKLVDDAKDARLILGVEGEKVFIYNGDLEAAAPPVPVSDPDHVTRVVEQVKELVHWIRVMDLKNPSGGVHIGLDIRRAGDPAGTPPPGEVESAARLTYLVRNLDTVPLYIYVLDISSDGSIALLYPQVSGAQEVLPAGESLEKTIETFLPEGRSVVVDEFKVIATTRPIDPSLFPQGSITRAAGTRSAGTFSDPLEEFLFNSILGTRGSRPVEVKSWGTRQQTVTIRQQGGRQST